MKHSVMRFIALVSFAALAAISVNAATITTIERNRTHTATGALGACTVSAATNATPIVVTCTGAHNLVDGDGILGASLGGNTAGNGTFFAKVTGYSGTTFGVYSDAALSTGVAGNGSWTSGGTYIKALDVSGLSGEFTLRLRLESMTAAKTITLVVQESADGFGSDIRALALWHLTPPASQTFNGVTTTQAAKTYVIHSRDIPTSRIGVTNTKWRLAVQDITSATAAVTSFYLEQ